MPLASQSDVLTSYLMFRLALNSWNHELACECLENLSKQSAGGQHHDILYACIKEAELLEDKSYLLVAMKAVVNSTGVDQSTTSNYLPLLRCTIRLTKLLDGAETYADINSQKTLAWAEDLCTAFEKGKQGRS